MRAANSLLHRRTFAFCINQGLLDPSKHVYMNHNPHNVYVDYWPIGQYPQLHLLQSVAPRTYEPEVQTIFIETFNSRYVHALSRRTCPSRRTTLRDSV